MTRAPILETARLTIRPYRPSDLDAHAAILADGEITRQLGAAPFSREESWRRMLCAPGLWDMLGYGYWAVERRSDGAFLGQVGFADFKRDMQPAIEGLPEMGWIFGRHAHGQGYAGEAVAAGLDWADQKLGVAEIVAIIDPGNAPSIRLAERAGFSEREDAVYRGDRILLFRRRQPGS